VRRAAAAIAGCAAVVVLLAGYGALDAVDAVPGPLTTTAPPTASPLPTAPGAQLAAATAAPVLPALTTGAPRPAPAALAASLPPLLADPALGPSVSASVADALTGDVLFEQAPAVTHVPASVTKLLTAAAALRALGPDARAETRVVAGADPGRVVLVAGGDVLLAAGAGNADAVAGHAGIADLAAATAQALLAQGRTTVAVGLDDRLFSGPATSPGWGTGDVGSGFVMPIAPLAVDEARLAPVENAPRAADPALAAATAFAAALGRDGVTVTPGVARAAAAPGAAVLATAPAATTAEVVELMLTTSDNTLAEVLARRVALAAGRPGTFDDASEAVVAQVAALGVDVGGAHLQGGSGLGRDTRLSARTLTGLLALVAGPEHPELRPVASGLPIAGATGTLLDRYDSPDVAGGAGVVRAKTGTLTGVSSLAGYVRDADGRLLAFAVLADAVAPGGSARARQVQDRFSTLLAGCGCR